MKNNKLTFAFFVSIMFFSIGCKKDILDTTARDAFAEDVIYSVPEQVERVVFPIYNSTESWGITRNVWWGRRVNIECASYEAKFNFRDLDNVFRLRGGWTAANSGLVFTPRWNNYSIYLRRANEFLDRIDDSEAMKVDPEKVGILKAEVKFLRANLYAKLIKYYGGVPILDRALGLEDDFALVRNTYEECVDFIVKELDEAAAVLPENRPATELGRATKAAALAVKSRTLLYAASKLHEPGALPGGGPLFDYNKGSKWEDAANAAKAVIDLVGGRDLAAVADAKEYQALFLSPQEDFLFVRPFSAELYDFGDDANSLWDQTQTPNGYLGWGLSSPTLNYALEYNMADGTTTENGTYNPNDPHTNREMRYYANLLFQGAEFRGRPVDYALAENPSEDCPNGLDSPEGLGNTLHSSKTGYNLRKFLDESVEVAGGISPNRPFVLYRLAEMYLNHAEALYELGREGEAREALNKVVRRALQPEITASGDALYEAIQRERRVELAFEGHSFFDERRWMIESHLGFGVRGLRGVKDASCNFIQEEYTLLNRPFDTKQYHLPIPLSEIEKAPTLLQNPGY